MAWWCHMAKLHGSSPLYDDVIKWKYFPRYWRSGHRWIPLTKASDAELWCFLWICARINGWVNNREACDLRRHRAHYDITVMDLDDCYLTMTPPDTIEKYCWHITIISVCPAWPQHHTPTTYNILKYSIHWVKCLQKFELKLINTFNFVVSTVPADGLAPLGARPSADTVMTKHRFHIDMKLALQGL